MGSQGGALIQLDQCPSKKRRSHQGCAHTEKRPCVDGQKTVKRKGSGEATPAHLREDACVVVNPPSPPYPRYSVRGSELTGTAWGALVSLCLW